MNLTDEQVIKALECCSEPAGKCCCEVCPLHHREDSCTTALIKKAVDLVNRQNKTMKYQAKEIVDLKIKVEQQKAEIERLGKILENRGEICKSCDEKYTEKIKRAKAEAVKEFAERLIHEIVNRPSEIQSTSVEYLHGSAYRQNEIVDLVKEMVGEE